MADYQLLAELLDLPHVQVAGYQILNSERIEVCIESRLDAAVCPHCQQVSTQMHDTAEPQMLRDLAIWGRECWLRYAPRRFACATCHNTFVERVAWREPGLAHTLRYARHIYLDNVRFAASQARRRLEAIRLQGGSPRRGCR